ncbi:hypothetical protein [Cellulomonas xylanilytica]|uniref:Uncharacterized protein n=1 Tax=Cellulomonas xylanilytica TaxID=233583 RepID=A0A510V5H2_9CELL|nr:hypothetical protein [Cellulomonas xylanilytica]GEK22114.1 hypothetical protein CXY01_26340 [Cellulomonas xylanilytica]
MASWVWYILVALLVAGLAWSLRPVRTAGPATPSQAWIAAERHARRVSAAAWAALVPLPVLLAAALTGSLSGPSRGAVVAALPAVAGIAFVAVHAAGELTWPRPAGAVRRAALARRRIRDVTPHTLAWLTAAWFAALGVLLTVCALAAGTGGRSLSYAHADQLVSTASPFPGAYYGRTIVPATVLLGLGCVGVLLLVARRAAVSDTSPTDDVALRRTSAARILAGVQLVAACTLAGCLFFAANAVAAVQPRWADAFGRGSSEVVGTVGRLTALVIVIVSVVVAVRASRARPSAPASQRAEPYTQPAQVAA